MSVERGLFIVKPDGLGMGELEEARAKIEASGLLIQREEAFTFTPEQVEEFYADKRDQWFYMFFPYLCHRPSVALVVIGKKTNRILSEIKKELRNRPEHEWFYTGTHSSDDEKTAEKEMKILGLKFEPND